MTENTEGETQLAETSVALASCRARSVYRLWSRNLTLGVFDGREGFIGIRTKIGARFLFREFHWDTGPPFGTARAFDVVGVVPDDIELVEYEPTRCRTCGALVAYIEWGEGVEGNGYQGRWCHIDETGSALCDEDSTGSCAVIKPFSTTNSALFSFLDDLECSVAVEDGNVAGD